MAFGHFFGGLSQIHGHGSWLVCEVALNSVVVLLVKIFIKDTTVCMLNANLGVVFQNLTCCISKPGIYT